MQSQAERQHLFRKSVLEMLLAGVINSGYDVFRQETGVTQPQIIDQEKGKQAKLFAAYLAMNPVYSSLLFQESLMTNYPRQNSPGNYRVGKNAFIHLCIYHQQQL